MPISWAYAVDSATGRPVENPEARYRGAAALVRPGPVRRSQLAPDGVQPADGPGVSAGSGECPRIRPRRRHRSRGPDSTISASPSTRCPTTRPCGPPSRAPRRACCSPGTLSRSARCGGRTGRGPWNGGTLATAGGLVFQGTGDGQFLALDARTGKTLWSTDNQAATLAGPISYEIGGEQYVAVLGGYGGSFFLIEGFVAAVGGQRPQRPRVRVQAGRHGAAAGAESAEGRRC